MTNPIQLILTSAPDKQVAKQISQTLIEQKIAACVHIYPAVDTLYTWEEKMESSTEIPIMIKTTTSLCDIVIKAIKTNHPYTLPEILCIPVESSSDYQAWVETSCHSKNL